MALVGVDAFALVAAFALAYAVRFKAGIPLLETPPYSGALYSSVVVWAVPVWLALFAAYGLYDRRQLFTGFQEYARIINACTTGVIAEVLLSFLEIQLPISRGWLLLTWLLSILLTGSGRFAMRRVLWSLRGRGLFWTPALIVGANGEGVALAEQLASDARAGTRLVGFVDHRKPVGARVLGGLRVIGTLGDLSDRIEQTGATEVIVATTALTREQLLDLYRTVGQDPSVVLRLSSGLFEILTTGMRVQEINCVPLMTPDRVRITGLDAVLKGILDYAGAAAALIVLGPVLLSIAILVRLDSPGSALHRRRVLGVGGKPFYAYKFRTMIENAERRQQTRPIDFSDRRSTFKSREDPRITRLGRVLRRTSLDESPQLLNVLRGEMSLVGPRMIAPDEAAHYGKWQLNLVTVKPGLTGPWQVEGRCDIPYEERVRLSMHYIRNHSIWLDLDILRRTVVVVLRGKGAY